MNGGHGSPQHDIAGPNHEVVSHEGVAEDVALVRYWCCGLHGVETAALSWQKDWGPSMTIRRRFLGCCLTILACSVFAQSAHATPKANLAQITIGPSQRVVGDAHGGIVLFDTKSHELTKWDSDGELLSRCEVPGLPEQPLLSLANWKDTGLVTYM